MTPRAKKARLPEDTDQGLADTRSGPKQDALVDGALRRAVLFLRPIHLAPVNSHWKIFTQLTASFKNNYLKNLYNL
jgi:hypothetical protein